MPRRPAKPKTRRPKDWRPRFLALLTGGRTVQAAAAGAGVGRRTAYDRRAADGDFAAAWAEAVEAGTEALEDEARRRAVDGVLRPVYQGGVKVGQVREYSDALLIVLLKGRKPAVYRDRGHLTVAGDPAAPVKHDHGGSVFDRVDKLAELFMGGWRPADGLPPEAAGLLPDPAAVDGFLADLAGAG